MIGSIDSDVERIGGAGTLKPFLDDLNVGWDEMWCSENDGGPETRC